MPEIDYSGVSMDLGAEVFGSDPVDNAGTGGDNPGGATPPNPSLAATPPVPPNTPPIVDEDKWKDMPKAWKMEKKALWDRLQADREIREYIHTRESDVVKGFDQYSTGHKSWTELTTPFQSVLQQHPNVNPVQLMQSLMKNHLAIVQGSPEQKKQLASALLKSYGIELGTPGNPAPTPPPEVQQALHEARQAREYIQRFEATQQQEALRRNTEIVEAFAADPKHKYFAELGDDIIHLMQTGAAPSLEKAYEQACWINPAVRAKILAEQSENKPPPAKQPLNVNGSGGTPPTKPKTFEDTVDGIMEKHYGPNYRNLN